MEQIQGFTASVVLLLVIVAAGASCQQKGADTADASVDATVDAASSSSATYAFFYKKVGVDGGNKNAALIGTSEDGVHVHSTNRTVVQWNPPNDATDADPYYGDPVFSLLPDGKWTMMAWRRSTASTGVMQYWESSCPLVDHADVIALLPSTAPGCKQTPQLLSGRTSHVISSDGSTYVFHGLGGGIYLARLSSKTERAADLQSICVLETPVDALAGLAYAHTTRVFSSETLLTSDVSIAQRSDGVWVMYFKGTEKAAHEGCQAEDLCELCGRDIYRVTSNDLIHWSEPELVVSEASLPDVVTQPDGALRLYWQDFSDFCAIQQLPGPAGAPISTAYEQAGTYQLSTPERIVFLDEAFQTDTALHYAGNASPVLLPDLASKNALEACLK